MLRKRYLLFVTQIILNSVLGYAFTRLIAFKLGASATKDVFDIAYAIPFLVLKLCGFGILHGVALTQFGNIRSTQNQCEANKVFSTLLTLMLIMCVMLALLAFNFRESISQALAPGLSTNIQDQLQVLLQYMLPLSFFLGIGVFLSGVLIAYDIPLSSEFAQIGSRVFAIFWLLTSAQNFHVETVALALISGSILAVLLQMTLVISKTPVRYVCTLKINDETIKKILYQLPGLLSAAVIAQFAFFNMHRMATFIGPGTASTISYCLFIVSPLSLLIGKPLYLLHGTRLTNLHKKNEHGAAAKLFIKLLIAAILITIPLSIVLIFLAEPLIALMYGGGAFDAEAITRTARLTRISLWAIPAAVIYWITLVPTLSLRRSELSGAVLATGNVIQIIFSFLLFQDFKAEGLVAAYVIGINSQAIITTILGWTTYQFPKKMHYPDRTLN